MKAEEKLNKEVWREASDNLDKQCELTYGEVANLMEAYAAQENTLTDEATKEVAMAFAELTRGEEMTLSDEIDTDFEEHLWWESMWKQYDMDNYETDHQPPQKVDLDFELRRFGILCATEWPSDKTVADLVEQYKRGVKDCMNHQPPQKMDLDKIHDDLLELCLYDHDDIDFERPYLTFDLVADYLTKTKEG